MGERLDRTQEVGGSIPPCSTQHRVRAPCSPPRATTHRSMWIEPVRPTINPVASRSSGGRPIGSASGMHAHRFGCERIVAGITAKQRDDHAAAVPPVPTFPRGSWFDTSIPPGHEVIVGSDLRGTRRSTVRRVATPGGASTPTRDIERSRASISSSHGVPFRSRWSSTSHPTRITSRAYGALRRIRGGVEFDTDDAGAVTRLVGILQDITPGDDPHRD
jgi:hypothetical protein